MAFETQAQAGQGNLAIPPSDARSQQINPFRGLEFFDSEHAPFFHGRTKIVAEALELLRQQVADKKPFLLVLGPAGSGKTSLIRAGLLPALTRPGVTEGTDHSWRLAFTRPGNGGAGDPFDALAAALLEKSALPELPEAGTPNGWKNLAAELREAPDNIALRLRETLRCLNVQALDHLLDEHGSEASPANPEKNVELPHQNKPERVDSKLQLALVVDQLEELFVAGFSPELQQRFITALGTLVRWRVAVVIAGLRTDFYAHFEKCCSPQDLGARNQPDLFARNIDLSEVLKGKFDVYPPTSQEMEEIIRLPAEAIGLQFEVDPETGRHLDAALLEAASACGEPLPPLEHLLWQLYQKQLLRKDGLLRWSDYRESGEFEGALANHAESVFLALEGGAQAAFKPIVRHLVSPGPCEDGRLIRRMAAYSDLTSAPGFSEDRKTGAERLIDLFIKERFFHSEKGPNAEVLVSFAQECVLRNWPRVRQLLSEDLGLLRARDRLEPNFRLWSSGGRRNRHLVRTRPGIRDAGDLLKGFRTSLSQTRLDYLRRSLRLKNRRNWFQGAAVLAIVAGLVAPFANPGAQWLRANMERRKAEQSSGPEERAHAANTNPQSVAAKQRQEGNDAQLPQQVNAATDRNGPDVLQGRLKESEARTQQIQKNLELAINQRDAMQNRLDDSEAKAQQAQKNAVLAANQRDELQGKLKDSEAKAEQAQKDAALSASQRDELQGKLKHSEAKAEQAQKDAALSASQRAALQSQLKDSEAKAEQAQKAAALSASQRAALQSQLKDSEARAQQVQKDAALATSQRDALQGQLKDSEARAEQAQKDVALVSSQRDELQSRLKDAETKAEQAQKDAALVSSQRDDLRNQLKESAPKNAEITADQRNALQKQLRDTEAKAQKAQKDEQSAASQSDAFQNQLKDTEARAQQAQNEEQLAASQRDALQNQLKDVEAKAQEYQRDAALVASQHDALQGQLQRALKDAELAAGQRDALQARLTEAEARAQEAQKNADLAASQRDALQAQLQNTNSRVQQPQRDEALAANQRNSSEDESKPAATGGSQGQPDAASAAEQSQPQQEQQSATSKPAPAGVPATAQGEKEQAAALQNPVHRSQSESARPPRTHRTRAIRTRNSAESASNSTLVSQIRYHWYRFWQRVRANAP